MSWLKNDIHLSLLFFSQRKWKQRHNFHLLKKIRTDHQWPSSPDSNYTDVSNEDYVITYPFDVTARSGGTNNTAYVTSGDDENDFAFNKTIWSSVTTVTNLKWQQRALMTYWHLFKANLITTVWIRGHMITAVISRTSLKTVMSANMTRATHTEMGGPHMAEPTQRLVSIHGYSLLWCCDVFATCVFEWRNETVSERIIISDYESRF